MPTLTGRFSLDSVSDESGDDGGDTGEEDGLDIDGSEDGGDRVDGIASFRGGDGNESRDGT